MKKIEKICMAIVFLCALISFVLGIITGTSWAWQIATMAWVSTSYSKQKLVDRYENLIKNINQDTI